MSHSTDRLTGIDGSAAITASVVAVASAIIGVVVAAGLDLSKDLTDQIILLITVLTPVVVGAIAMLNRNHAKTLAAATLADSSTTNSASV